MMLDAHSSMNLVARHFIGRASFSLFLCILKPEAYAQKLDRSKTPAQLHIMNWHPDRISSTTICYCYTHISSYIYYAYSRDACIVHVQVQEQQAAGFARTFRHVFQASRYDVL